MRLALASILALALPTSGAADEVYGSKGMFEAGASAGMVLAPDLRSINLAPVFGWFVTDNLELAAIISASNLKAGDDTATAYAALVEPAYHVPFNASTFGFLGMGVGVAYVDELGAGLDIAPRVGLKVMMGTRGVLAPSLSYEYTTHNVDPDEMKNVALVAVASAVRINIGYAAMW